MADITEVDSAPVVDSMKPATLAAGGVPAWDDYLAHLPPLDIAVVSRAIAQIWRDAMDRVMEVNGLGSYQTPFLEFAGLHEKIVDLLKMYDEGRTRHLKFLTSELIRMHRLVGLPVLLPREMVDPKGKA